MWCLGTRRLGARDARTLVRRGTQQIFSNKAWQNMGRPFILDLMVKRRSIEVFCQCGAALARYKKGGKGRLRKMFFERIAVDHAGVFLTDPPLPLHRMIHCPACSKRVATVQIVNGKYAAKMNQGAIQPI